MNKTNERRQEDPVKDASEAACTLANSFMQATGTDLPAGQARQIIARHGEARARQKLDLLRWQRHRGGFTSGPLAYYLASLAGDWLPPATSPSRLALKANSPDARDGTAQADGWEFEAQAEILMQALSQADRERLREEVEATAAGTGAPIPDFVAKTELMRRVVLQNGPGQEVDDGGAS